MYQYPHQDWLRLLLLNRVALGRSETLGEHVACLRFLHGPRRRFPKPQKHDFLMCILLRRPEACRL